jgi:hypothetical protein
LLAYTNRFVALANLVRKLHDEYISGQKNKLPLKQIDNLRRGSILSADNEKKEP